nr:MAG TPA: hypothetical protein [Caudoviricetes sp.]
MSLVGQIKMPAVRGRFDLQILVSSSRGIFLHLT